MRAGIKVLEDTPGSGLKIERQHTYLVRLKLWLNQGEPVKWTSPSGLVDRARLEDDGETQISDLRIDRESLINGLFYGVDGMRIGGRRKLKISPHLAYGKNGIPGLIPADAVIIAELSVLEERLFRTA
ncbi:MAG: FKBP-type peptidyl-prolyl cis-trans isomerase [Halopseudomonas sp.]